MRHTVHPSTEHVGKGVEERWPAAVFLVKFQKMIPEFMDKNELEQRKWFAELGSFQFHVMK